MTAQGIEFEELCHTAIGILPNVHCMRELDIMKTYGDHITGIDHLVICGDNAICIQDKQEISKPNTRDISHLKAQTDILALRLPDKKFHMIFASKTQCTIRGGSIMADSNIQHLYNVDIAKLIPEIVCAVAQIINYGDLKQLYLYVELFVRSKDIDIIELGCKKIGPIEKSTKINETIKPIEITEMEKLESRMMEFYIGIKQNFNNYLRCQIHDKTAMLFEDAFAIGDCNLSKLPIKQLWKDYCTHINSPEYGCRGSFSFDSNMSTSLSNIIKYSNQYDALSHKPKYKWKPEYIKILPVINYHRARYFTINTASSNVNDYGRKYWTKLIKLSTQDLYFLGENINKFGYGIDMSLTPEVSVHKYHKKQ